VRKEWKDRDTIDYEHQVSTRHDWRCYQWSCERPLRKGAFVLLFRRRNGVYKCEPMSSGNTLLKSASISIGFVVSRGRARLCRRARYD
jgi:hypothetical protein